MVYAGLLILFIASIWSWGHEALPYQMIIQIAVSMLLAVYLIPKIVAAQTPQIVQVREDGQLRWLLPASDCSWQITPASRFNGWWHWLNLRDPVLNSRKMVLVFKDSIAESDWRHLCRIVNQISRTSS